VVVIISNPAYDDEGNNFALEKWRGGGCPGNGSGKRDYGPLLQYRDYRVLSRDWGNYLRSEAPGEIPRAP